MKIAAVVKHNCEFCNLAGQKVLMDLDMDRDHALTDNCR
jgi:hypothetical protein